MGRSGTGMALVGTFPTNDPAKRAASSGSSTGHPPVQFKPAAGNRLDGTSPVHRDRRSIPDNFARGQQLKPPAAQQSGLANTCERKGSNASDHVWKVAGGLTARGAVGTPGSMASCNTRPARARYQARRATNRSAVTRAAPEQLRTLTTHACITVDRDTGDLLERLRQPQSPWLVHESTTAIRKRRQIRKLSGDGLSRHA